MFDFFRDVYLESQGIDSLAAQRIRNEKIEIKKLNRFIFSKKMKILVYIFGVLYLGIAGLGLYFLDASDKHFVLYFKYIFLIILDIAICMLLVFGKKREEIIAIICILVFILLNYISILI